MFAGSSPPRDDSPLPILPLPPSHPPSRKRKHGATAGAHADTPEPATAEHSVLPARHDLSSRPRLTISRFPILVPISEGSPYHNTEQSAVNRVGYRYTPAGILPPNSSGITPFRTIESNPTSFRVSWEDRSPFVKVTKDGLGLLGDKGYRSARCNAPIREGKWYVEIKIDRGGGDKPPSSTRREGSHVRLGWGRRESPLNSPVGLDGYSYGIRDKTGEKIHCSRTKPYAKEFGTGDVIGMYISLPPRRQPDPHDPHDPAHLKRERIAIDFKGQEHFESLEYTQSKEMNALMDGNASKTSSGGVGGSVGAGGHGGDVNKPSNGLSHPSPTKKSATVKNLPSKPKSLPSRSSKNALPAVAPLRPLPTLGSTSYISFFINGEDQGIAFSDLYSYLPLRVSGGGLKGKGGRRKGAKGEGGVREHKENLFDDGSLGYYVFISLFNDAMVTINPGPEFEFPPPPDIDALYSKSDPDRGGEGERTWRPIVERYPEYMAEQWELDKLDEIAAEAEYSARAKEEKAEAAKKAGREKKRAVAEGRKKARKEEEERIRRELARREEVEEEVVGQRKEEEEDARMEEEEEGGEGEGARAEKMEVEEDDRFGPGADFEFEFDIKAAEDEPGIEDHDAHYSESDNDPNHLMVTEGYYSTSGAQTPDQGYGGYSGYASSEEGEGEVDGGGEGEREGSVYRMQSPKEWGEGGGVIPWEGV
ncbi:hypothetical protein JAAARDRAFT_33066 [Jaapia argillacea MUCL 33604]|uniref:B30.2/SPRY domain-containing protein n=1 Tax=Jaapia argillacea MUCL 33604 TaxID=933084 RepID=A0A067Q7N6_9AGAM|nr:hypothetical protein JAAARDRAFT_33066 [Jaapia argillacea MUCL 33604]